MTVRQLIEKLSTLPQNVDVKVGWPISDSSWHSRNIGEIRTLRTPRIRGDSVEVMIIGGKP